MGVLDRLILREDQWDQLSRYIIRDDRTQGSSGRDNRIFKERSSGRANRLAWHDMADVFGDRNSVFRRWRLRRCRMTVISNT